MAVSEKDREAMRRQAADLATIESDEELTGPARDRAIAAANRRRVERGIAPLKDPADRPELAFYEFARARGLLRRVREDLADLGVEAVLAGAMAALEYRAEARFTTDVDFLIRDETGVADGLRALGFEVFERAAPNDRPHLLVVRGKGHKVDLLVAQTEYQDTALDRARNGYLTAEDVIVHKLIAWRPRDRDDIASILETGMQLDAEYIERWADEWGVRERWDAARAR